MTIVSDSTDFNSVYCLMLVNRLERKCRLVNFTRLLPVPILLDSLQVN